MNRFADFTKSLILRSLKIAQWVIVLTLFVWAAGVFYYFEPLPKWLCVLLSLGYLFSAVYLRLRIKNAARWLQIVAASVVVVYVVSLVQRPLEERRWAEDNAIMPEVKIVDGTVKVSGFRHSVYRSETDFDVHYRDYEFQLDELDCVWFVVQRFTALEGIAHNFLTFSLDTTDGPKYLSVSVEIRREQGEAFSPIRGLYRQYELIYVIADERDEIGSRTVLRPDDRVFLYPVNATPEQVQELFLDITGRVNVLRDNPEFYHSLANNCTNNIVNHAGKFTPIPISSLDPRVLAPGFADRLAFATELIGQSGESFEELTLRCRIDEIARRVGITESFSEDIRGQ